MKILLIDPNDRYIGRRKSQKKVVPLLGLAYIATILKANGHEVIVLDPLAAGISQLKELAQEVKNEDPDVIALTATTPFATHAYEIARLAKEIYPQAKVVLGGHHASAIKQMALEESPFLDFIIFGEGEKTIIELTEALEGKRNFSQIAGLGFRSNGDVFLNEPRVPLKNLDTLPFPDWSLYSYQNYSFTYSPRLKKMAQVYQILSSRGCPSQCTFCYQIFGKTYRSRSAENVVDEIERNHAEFGAVYFDFVDPTFTMNFNHFKSLCREIIKRRLHKKIAWTFETRADRVTESLMEQAFEAGAESVLFGIESGDAFMRGKMSKTITEPEIKEAIATASRAGLRTKSSFIIGHPYETKKSVYRSLKLARYLKMTWETDILAGIVGVYPDTETWEMVEAGEGGSRWRPGVKGNWIRSVRTNPMIEVNDLKTTDLIGFLKEFESLRV